MENRKRACSAPAGPSDAEHRNKRQALADDKQPAAAHAPPSALIGAQARADVYNQALTTQTRKNSAVELSTPGAYATPNTMLLLRSLAGMLDVNQELATGLAAEIMAQAAPVLSTAAQLATLGVTLDRSGYPADQVDAVMMKLQEAARSQLETALVLNITSPQALEQAIHSVIDKFNSRTGFIMEDGATTAVNDRMRAAHSDASERTDRDNQPEAPQHKYPGAQMLILDTLYTGSLSFEKGNCDAIVEDVMANVEKTLAGNPGMVIEGRGLGFARQSFVPYDKSKFGLEARLRLVFDNPKFTENEFASQIPIRTGCNSALTCLALWNPKVFPQVLVNPSNPAKNPGSNVSIFDVLEEKDGLHVGDAIEAITSDAVALGVVRDAFISRVRSKAPDSRLFDRALTKAVKNDKNAQSKKPWSMLLDLASDGDRLHAALEACKEQTSDSGIAEEWMERVLYALALKEQSAFPEVFT